MKKAKIVELPIVSPTQKTLMTAEQYCYFASLSIDERRRIVFENYMKIYPHSLLTNEILSGSYPIPKKRGRKLKTVN